MHTYQSLKQLKLIFKMLKIIDLQKETLNIDTSSSFFQNDKNSILSSFLDIVVMCNAFFSLIFCALEFLTFNQGNKNELNKLKMIFGTLYLFFLVFTIRNSRINQEKNYKDFQLLQQNLIFLNEQIDKLNKLHFTDEEKKIIAGLNHV